MEGRKRLRPWLWQHTDAGDYGLRWVNKDERMFRIPWMHRSNRCWNKDHCQVFKEWAKFTMRYNEGNPEDYPAWKTRLRTALTKLSKDFEEVHDLHNLEDEANPYKVYRFKTTDNPRDAEASSPGYSPSSSQSSDASQCSPLSACPSSPSPHSNFHQGASPYQRAGNIPNIVGSPDSSLLGPDPVGGDMNIDPSCGSQGLDNGLMDDQQNTGFDLLESVDMLSLPNNSGNLPSDLLSLDSGNLMKEKLPSSEIGVYQKDLKQGFDGIPNESQPDPPRMIYKIFYLGEIVQEGKLSTVPYLFHFGQIPDVEVSCKVFGPRESERIEFPDVTRMKRSISSEHQTLIQKALMQMDRGFLLQWYNRDIYAQRLCRTRVFANSPSTTNQLLDRRSNEPTKIFDFTEFKTNYLGDNRVSPNIVLSFAQELRLDSLRTSLMRFELISLEAEGLFTDCSGNSLQISDLNSGDQELQNQLGNLHLG